MSWLDRIQNTVFTIITGDGKSYTPLWKSGETSKEFNEATYEFNGLDGGLVARRRVKARQFPLTFWFTGADNIDQTDAFDTSANDQRAWTVRHPYYGNITGHPISIKRNDNDYNATEVTVEFRETISGNPPAQQISIVDEVAGNYTTLSSTSSANYAAKVNLKPVDVNQITSLSQKIDAQISAAMDAVNYNAYVLAKNSIFDDITNLILDPVDVISAMYAFLSIPSQLVADVSIRLELLNAIYGSVKGLLSIYSANNKAFFESAGAACIGSVCNTLVNPAAGDYLTRGDIATANDSLTSLYNDYLATLDNAYVNITDPINGFSASQETQTGVQELVIETMANLNALAFAAKQQRIIYTDNDTNLILLTHKYMGLDVDDVNLEQFRQLNNIRNKLLFNIPKGTQITYLV